jgi:propionate CoA-transferase
MKVPAESLSGPSVRDKVVTAADAVRLIRDGDAVVVEGFVGQGFAEELTLALEERFPAAVKAACTGHRSHPPYRRTRP